MTDSELDIFLAHSVELESEARDRYQELAEAMASHNNTAVAEFFLRMVAESRQHLAEVESIAGERRLPRIEVWNFDWPEAEPPETASYEALHYRMSLRQAMALALDNERAAERYYRSSATATGDAETQQVASLFADGELSHAAKLEEMIASLPADGDHLRFEDDDPVMPE